MAQTIGVTSTLTSTLIHAGSLSRIPHAPGTRQPFTMTGKEATPAGASGLGVLMWEHRIVWLVFGLVIVIRRGCVERSCRAAGVLMSAGSLRIRTPRWKKLYMQYGTYH